ncbi:hypothetical protein [Streptomyces sp. NPDC048584]|uniref:hypothetical protein n=1 Tax=Streptomyces sp. NPDC048584 TaxID=3365573 RepID=UPI003723723A
MARALTETAYHTDYQGVRFISLHASTGDARSLMTPDDLPECSEDCPDPEQLWLGMQGRRLDHVLKGHPGTWAVKEPGDVLDSFAITTYDDGTKYVTEDGVPVPPAPVARH